MEEEETKGSTTYNVEHGITDANCIQYPFVGRDPNSTRKSMLTDGRAIPYQAASKA